MNVCLSLRCPFCRLKSRMFENMCEVDVWSQPCEQLTNAKNTCNFQKVNSFSELKYFQFWRQNWPWLGCSPSLVTNMWSREITKPNICSKFEFCNVSYSFLKRTKHFKCTSVMCINCVLLLLNKTKWLCLHNRILSKFVTRIRYLSFTCSSYWTF